MTTMRLQRLHLSSSPCPRTLAINWPHSQRVSVSWHEADDEWLCVGIQKKEILRNQIENDY